MDHTTDQDDVMLSSAEDLNNEMDFGMEPSAETALDEEIADLERTSEPEPELAPDSESEPKPEAPIKPKPPVHREFPRHEHSHHGHCAPKVCRTAEPGILTVEPAKINKLALAWMIILTIILAGVVGILIYAFIVYQGGNTSPDNQDTSIVEQGGGSSVAIAGALEVYLSNVDLNRYDSDIVLVSNGGVIKVTGTLKHTLYVNATDTVRVVLDDVTIASKSAAIVNASDSKLTIEVSSASSVSAHANKFGAVIYSSGLLEFTGEGGLAVSALDEGVKPIVTTDGFNLNGTKLTALSKAENEIPLDSSEQGYIIKTLKGTHSAKTVITAAENESGNLVAEFTADCDFSNILLSNPEIKNDTLYRIDFDGGEKATEE